METCRLCKSPVSPVFRKTVVGRHNIVYFLCSGCGSMQTEKPYWLEEVYSDPRPLADVGIVQRCTLLSMQVHALLIAFGITRDAACIDWGGANGLFTRMMRDRGYNFFSHDPFRENFYVPFHGSDALGEIKGAIITAFEVLEHLPNPESDLEQIFATDADLLIFTTVLYRGEGEDWWYIGAETGQHVFFYSPGALAMIAESHGRSLMSRNNIHIIYKDQPTKLSYDEPAIERVRKLLGNEQLMQQEMIQTNVQQIRAPYRFVEEDYKSILARIEAGEKP